MVLETALAIAAIVTAVAGTAASMQAQAKTNEAQEKARKMQNAGARIEAMHRARRAVAERRMMQAELQQMGETQGARSSSAITGAAGSLSTQTAANIGFMNTQVATDWGINTALTRGARSAARWDTVSGAFNVANSVVTSPQFGNWASKNFQGTATGRLATPQEQYNWRVNGTLPQGVNPNG
jgi:hypothetical protein